MFLIIRRLPQGFQDLESCLQGVSSVNVTSFGRPRQHREAASLFGLVAYILSSGLPTDRKQRKKELYKIRFLLKIFFFNIFAY